MRCHICTGKAHHLCNHHFHITADELQVKKGFNQLPIIFSINYQLGKIKKISVFRVMGLKILGRVGTHSFFIFFFFWKKYDFMHFERLFAFQNA